MLAVGVLICLSSQRRSETISLIILSDDFWRASISSILSSLSILWIELLSAWMTCAIEVMLFCIVLS